MESLNLFKGYGKVNPNNLEGDQSLPNNASPERLRLIAISAILFLTVVLALTVGSLIHESVTESPESPSLGSISAESAIRIVCNVTLHPDSCFVSLSAANRSPHPDPESILKLAVQVSLVEIANFSASLNSTGSPGDVSLRDCRDLIDDAASRLADSEAKVDHHLTDGKLKDLMTWLSAALTDCTTCLDGLEEMGSSLLGDIKGKMENSKQYTSNALAIVAHFHDILDRFGLPRH